MLLQQRNAHLEKLRQACSGRWSFVISSICRIPESVLDGKHHPCPSGQCKSQKDGFRVFPDFDKSGGSVCNQCGKHSDGFATIGWLTGQRFPEVLKLVGSLLGVEPSKPKQQQADPADNLDWCPWNDALAAMWCMSRKPIIPEAIKLVGGRMAVYRGQYKVIALPVWVSHKSNIVGWRIFNIRGKLPRQTKDKSGKPSVEWVKSKLTYGSQPGVVGNLAAKAEAMWKVEGETDMLSLLSINPRASVICNASGAGESPTKFNWIKDSLGKANEFLVVHDADQPGQSGAVRWSSYFAAILGAKVRVSNVELPYPIQETKGRDLRDWLADGNGYDVLVARAGKFAAVAVDDQSPEESEDDPHRLARINLEQYEKSYGGRIVFWRSEWWKYKAGRYRKIEKDELQAKLTASIRHEFERCWRVRQEKNSDDADQPIKKVTTGLVINVVGALKSMVTIPASIQMPCWLPDRGARNYLSMKNGILDLNAVFSGEKVENCLLSHSPSWFASLKLDYDFDLNATCPQWDSYLDFVCGNDLEKRNLMQEWVGYLLWPRSIEQKFLVFEGDGGTGKSTFFAGVTAVLGDENVSSLSLENFGNQFGLASTIGKVCNIAGDVGRIEGNEEAILKRYTGGDKMTIDRKNISPIEMRPTAKLMMAWNERPRFRDKSWGLWRRMILIPLNKRVEGNVRVRGMDSPEYWKAEAPGIMLWALAGLARLLEQGDFSRCSAASAALDDYQTEANPVREFFREYVQPAPGGAIRCDVVYKMYQSWCENTGHKSLNSAYFGKQLISQTGATKVRKSDSCVRFYQYEGIEFSEFGQSIFNELIQKDLF
jgi:P4 family phage/plasmid primase-like protien